MPSWVVVLAVVWLVLAALLLMVVPRGLARLSRPVPPGSGDVPEGRGPATAQDDGP